VMRGDPALGDDPGGPGGQRLADRGRQGTGNPAGDGEAARSVTAGGDRAAGVEQHIGPPQRPGDLLSRGRHHVAGAAQNGGDVELDADRATACAEGGKLTVRAARVGPGHDQAMTVAPVRMPYLVT